MNSYNIPLLFLVKTLMRMANIRTYSASVIGEILEWYDFSWYGFLGPVFATLIFLQQSFLVGVFVNRHS
jgi:hypothetical protein